MPDYVLKSPDQASFMAAAERLGYVTTDPTTGAKALIVQGLSADHGDYFINVVNGDGVVKEPTGTTLTGPMGDYPEMAPIPGFWVRIRANNGGPIPEAPPGFTVYPPVKYLQDGVTPDPSYVQPPYGVIA